MSEETGEADRAVTFADALADLKERGSMLLVVGTGGNLAAACENLRGGDSERRQLLVHTGGPSAGPDASAGAPSRSIRYQFDARSTAAGADAGGRSPDSVVDGDLSDLQAAVDEAIAAMEPGDGYDPAELRVCVDAADVLLSRHDDARVFQFVHALGGRMRETTGMCHVHLPVAFDDEHVQLLSPLFDGIVEVRHGSEQRWHLHDPDLTTDWLAL